MSMEKIIEIEKTNILSEISRDIGQVFFASLFVNSFLQNEINWYSIIFGFILSLGFWYVSLLIIQK